MAGPDIALTCWRLAGLAAGACRGAAPGPGEAVHGSLAILRCVATGSTNVTTEVDVPPDLPTGRWHLAVIANGIASPTRQVEIVLQRRGGSTVALRIVMSARVARLAGLLPGWISRGAA